MINDRPPPVVLVLGTGALEPTPLPLLIPSKFQVVDERRTVDGVDAARALQPAVVLVDVGGDHTKGLDLCRALQAEPQTRNIPLIAISGAPDIGQFMMTMRVKVCNADTLSHEISRLIS
jgi:CheY-like chemotaxis protein